MAKKAKKLKAGPIAIGIAALAAVGALVPSEEAPETPEPEKPAVIEQAKEPKKTPVEELVEDQISETPKKESQTTQGTKPEPSKETTVPEIDPEQAFREMLNQYNYVGSSESDKYHKPKCRWTDTINDSNLVHFETEEEAAAAGYQPCGTCKP